MLKVAESAEIRNEVLHHGLAHDFSLYYTATKQPHVWDSRSLLSLIEHNPGRVASGTDLLKKHGENVPLTDAILQAVVRKLLQGEKAEVRNGEFEISAEKIMSAIEFLNQTKDVTSSEAELDMLLEQLVAFGAVEALRLVKLDPETFCQWIHGNLDKADAHSFLVMSQIVFDYDPSLLSKGMLSKVLATAGTLPQPKKTQVLLEFGVESGSVAEYVDQILQYIEAKQLDVDKRDPESLLLRMQLMETYGIDKNDLDSALQRFHSYQSKEDFGIELVQTKLVQAYCYQAVRSNDKTLYKIAQTLIVPDYLPVSTIAQLILAGGVELDEKSLAIYNDYIQQVSKEVNATTHRSPTGVLTEALMVASLYARDREFAHLLYEKAIASKIISDELEVANMKKVFKVYGDAFADDKWEVAQPILRDYVLQSIKK